MTRRIVITGASSGLGAALAETYAQPGIALGLVGRDTTRLAAIAETCRAKGATVTGARVDVADTEAMAAWLLDFDAGGPVDLVIANAGTSAGAAGPTEAEGTAKALLQIRVNLIGVVNTIEPLLPAMIARGRGQVAMVGSVAGFRGVPDSPAYCASKAGVHAYGDALRGRLAPLGIKVSVISPGFFRSRMSDRYDGAKPLLLETAEAAAIVRRGLDRGAGRIVFPRRLACALRLVDLLPAALGDAILRRARFQVRDAA